MITRSVLARWTRRAPWALAAISGSYLRGTVIVAVVAVIQPMQAYSQHLAQPPLPGTGVDFTAIDRFWAIADVLSNDRSPSEAQWRTLLETPGYRLARRAIGDVVRRDLELTFRPSLRVEFDSLSKLSDDRASRLRHLARAASLRPQLRSFQDSLRRLDIAGAAVAAAIPFLPPGATEVGDPPLVAFALFRYDGYSVRGGVVLDLLKAYESDFALFLGHEFHHTYLRRVGPPPVPSAPDHTALREALEHLRSEGIADLIDKPYPFLPTSPALEAYVRRYNEEYARTPMVIVELDSLLAIAAVDSTQIEPVGRRARSLLWNSGHAHGAYMARQILSTFGADSLFAGVVNPAAFLRTFAAAEVHIGRANPWSSRAVELIQAFERRYWSQN